MKNEKKARTYKKVALRFLKETGLLSVWMQYVKTKEYKKKLKMYSSETWYDKLYAEDIFGETQFSSFVRGKGIPLQYNFYHYFNRFLVEFYPEIARDYSSVNDYDKEFSLCVSLIQLKKQFPNIAIFERNKNGEIH